MGLLVAGVDEVGRGCVAGDVYSAAVILAEPIAGLKDSKKLSARQRERLSVAIKEQALAWAVGIASIAEIDEINILNATLLSMKRAVAQLTIKPHKILVDGNRSPDWQYQTEMIVGGDAIEPAIAAASIIAKVMRDNYMIEQSKLFGGYGFDRHKGYLTKRHRQAIESLGACPLHRRSFEPIKSRCAVTGTFVGLKY